MDHRWEDKKNEKVKVGNVPHKFRKDFSDRSERHGANHNVTIQEFLKRKNVTSLRSFPPPSSSLTFDSFEELQIFEREEGEGERGERKEESEKGEDGKEREEREGGGECERETREDRVSVAEALPSPLSISQVLSLSTYTHKHKSISHTHTYLKRVIEMSVD